MTHRYFANEDAFWGVPGVSRRAMGVGGCHVCGAALGAGEAAYVAAAKLPSDMFSMGMLVAIMRFPKLRESLLTVGIGPEVFDGGEARELVGAYKAWGRLVMSGEERSLRRLCPHCWAVAMHAEMDRGGGGWSDIGAMCMAREAVRRAQPTAFGDALKWAAWACAAGREPEWIASQLSALAAKLDGCCGDDVIVQEANCGPLAGVFEAVGV